MMDDFLCQQKDMTRYLRFIHYLLTKIENKIRSSLYDSMVNINVQN